MAVAIYTINSDCSTIEEFGWIENDDWEIIYNSAQQLQLDCLRFVYYAGDCTFNKSQVIHIIQQELPLLRQHASMTQKSLEALDAVEKAAHEIIKTVHVYLKFIGD